MISVIIPVYNAEKYLSHCVDSVLDQTYSDIEILLIDDGSTDRSAAMCDEMAHKDKRVIAIHKKNAGPASARNTGLESCTGDLVYFVDSDDCIDGNTLEVMERLQKEEDYDLVICGHQVIEGDHKAVDQTDKSIRTNVLLSEDIWEEVFGKLNNAVWNKLYKRELIGELRFQEDLFHNEDLLFNLAYIIRCQRALIIDQPFYHYYKRPDSITGSKFSERRFDEVKAKDRALCVIRDHCPAQIDNAVKYCFRARMNVLRALYRSGRDKDYQEQVSDYRAYTKMHYPEVVNNIRVREKVEYHLFQSAEPVYKWLTGIRD